MCKIIYLLCIHVLYHIILASQSAFSQSSVHTHKTSIKSVDNTSYLWKSKQKIEGSSRNQSKVPGMLYTNF